MSNPGSADIEFEDEYVLGLLDYCACPILQPMPMTNGYGLKKVIQISLRQSEILAGVVSQFLENKGIGHRYTRQNSNGIPERIKIEANEEIKNFYDICSGEVLQIAEQMNYMNKIIRKFEGKNIATNDELFLQIFKTWDEMKPDWENKKYTLEFFKKEFNIESIEDPIKSEGTEYPESISTEYVAGAFDGSGNISPQISKQPDNNTGYSMGFSACLTIRHPDIRVKPYFIQYFQKHDLDPNINENRDYIEISFNSIDNIELIIEKVGKHTTYLYEICDLLYSQLIPAYKDQYHISKEGFYDMVRAYEEAAPERKRAKYTAEYFEQEWNL